MSTLRLDHVSYAAGPEGLDSTVERIADALGLERVKGGVHPRFGTRNVLFPMRHGQYLEIVEVLDHPASHNAPFGQAVRQRSEQGGGWMGWVVSTSDLAPFEERLGRSSVPGNRKFPDGQELTWQQIGIKGLLADPQVPYIVRWDDGTEQLHPSLAAEPNAEIRTVTLAGSEERVRSWLGLDEPDQQVDDLDMEFSAPSGTPGLLSVSFETPRGLVTL
ncbi:MAG: VOC family protein [Micrococcus sp.]|nr:VOC family protein [Micrococcus sp.]